MVTHALDHRHGAGVPDREAFAGDPFDVGLAGDGAIEHRVADDDVGGGVTLGAGGLTDDHPPPGEALAHIVIAVAGELEGQAPGGEGAEALAGLAREGQADRAVGQAGVTMPTGDLARKHGADRTVDVPDGVGRPHRATAFQGDGAVADQLLVKRLVEAVLLMILVIQHRAVTGGAVMQDARQVNPGGLPMVDGRLHIDPVHTPHHLRHRAEAELRHDLAKLLGDEEEVVDDVLRLAGEPGAQDRILGGHPHRAGVEVAFAHHDAA